MSEGSAEIAGPSAFSEVCMNTIDRMKNLKQHLKAQINYANQVDSNWVYILKTEAEKCLELAEAEETFIDIMKDRKEQENETEKI